MTAKRFRVCWSTHDGGTASLSEHPDGEFVLHRDYLSLLDRLEGAERALTNLESACENLAAARSNEIYLAMVDAGQADLLLALDDARRNARTALQKDAQASGTPSPGPSISEKTSHE